MTKKDRILGIWLISMNLLSLFTYVIYIVSRMLGTDGITIEFLKCNRFDLSAADHVIDVFLLKGFQRTVLLHGIDDPVELALQFRLIFQHHERVTGAGASDEILIDQAISLFIIDGKGHEQSVIVRAKILSRGLRSD